MDLKNYTPAKTHDSWQNLYIFAKIISVTPISAQLHSSLLWHRLDTTRFGDPERFIPNPTFHFIPGQTYYFILDPSYH